MFVRVRFALPRTGSDEPVNSVVSTPGPSGPGGLCDVEGDIYEGDVSLYRTNSDKMVNGVVSTIAPGGPSDETGLVADAPGDVIVMSSECQEIDRGILDNMRMWRVNPQLESKVCCVCFHPQCVDCCVFSLMQYSKNMTVTKSLPGSLRRAVHSEGYRRCTVYVYITSGVMASGDAESSRPRVDRSGVSLRSELQTLWNTPESYGILESPGVVELETSVFPDVLGLRVLYEGAKSEAPGVP